MIYCKKQKEAEDNCDNMQQRKLIKHASYRKNGSVVFFVLYSQLNSGIVTIAKQSITTDFKTVHKERDVVSLNFIIRSICVQKITGSKVDPYLKQLKILTSTLSYVQKKGKSNHNFGDAVHDQVIAA